MSASKKTKERFPFRDWLESKPRGAASEVSRRLGVSREYVRKISTHETRISHDMAKRVAKITGLRIKDFSYWRRTEHDPS